MFWSGLITGIILGFILTVCWIRFAINWLIKNPQHMDIAPGVEELCYGYQNKGYQFIGGNNENSKSISTRI